MANNPQFNTLQELFDYVEREARRQLEEEGYKPKNPRRGMSPEELSKAGLSGRKIAILLVKKEHPGFGARRIADILEEHETSVSKDLVSLDKFGFI